MPSWKCLIIRDQLFLIVLLKNENRFPMIPSGEPHNKMLLGKASTKDAIGKPALCWYRPAPFDVNRKINTRMSTLKIKKGSSKHQLIT